MRKSKTKFKAGWFNTGPFSLVALREQAIEAVSCLTMLASGLVDYLSQTRLPENRKPLSRVLSSAGSYNTSPHRDTNTHPGLQYFELRLAFVGNGSNIKPAGPLISQCSPNLP